MNFNQLYVWHLILAGNQNLQLENSYLFVKLSRRCLGLNLENLIKKDAHFQSDK